MKNIDFKKLPYVGEAVDQKKQFRLMYIPDIDTYFMAIMIWWVAPYERYYRIEKADYELYLSNKDKFYEKFSREISNDPAVCFTENFAGSPSLRDYDGKPNFQNAYPTPDGIVNPFQHYGFEDGILYARIVWKDSEIYVPPVQAIKKGEKFGYPLRKRCELQNDIHGRPICYKFKCRGD
ncbi:MAG: hypothetical protein HDT44_08325 [Ruminococcaceae bacterium]|nr:hypothetical protein [Oscillospiraceae bacterium]